jgi:TIR domain
MPMEKIHIFISHITEEKETALRLKEFLKESLVWGLHIFVSSDYESIGGGDIWFTTIVKALKASPVEIVLLSTASVGRPWINFEAGVGIGVGSTVIPVVVHGLERGDVGHPLSSLQIRSLEDDENVRALVNDVGKGLGMNPRISHMGRFLSDINTKIAGSANAWLGVEWEGKYLAVDGPVLKLTERSPQPYQDAIGDALKAAGFKPYLASRQNLSPSLKKGYKVVYMTDRKAYRAEIEAFDVVLTAKPDDPLK